MTLKTTTRYAMLTSAIKAAKAAGIDKFRVDIDPDGGISLTVGEGAPIKDLTDAVRREREEDRRARRLG